MTSPLTPEQRSLRARIGAHALHAKHDPTVTTAPGRAAFLSRFAKQVDPDGVLPEAERQRRAQHALKAHMSRLAFNSAKARSVKKDKGPLSGPSATTVSTTDAATASGGRHDST